MNLRWLGLMLGGLFAARGHAEVPSVGYTDADGTHYVAITLEPRETAPVPIDLVVIMDLSASQSGPQFQTAIATTKSVVGSLIGGSRVSLWRLGGVEPVVAPALAVGAEKLTKALDQLPRLTPAGVADLPAMLRRLEPWLGDRSGDLPKSILYLGDGRSTGEVLTNAALTSFGDQCQRQQCAFYYVHPDESSLNTSLACLALVTGGHAWQTPRLIDLEGKLTDPPVTPTVFQSHRVMTALPRPAVRMDQIRLNAEWELLAPTPAWLASGRSTLLLAKTTAASPAEITLAISGTQAGKPVQWTERTTFASQSDRRYLKTLIASRQTRPELMLLGPDEQLHGSQSATAVRTEQVLAQAKGALAKRDLVLADALYREVLTTEPDSLEAKSGLSAVQSLQQSKIDPRPAATAPLTPSEDAIGDAKAKQRIELQRLQQVVDRSLAEASKMAKTDVDAAISLLKSQLYVLDASLEVDPDNVRRLKGRIEKQVRTYFNTRQRTQLEKLEQDRIRAAADARRRKQQLEVTTQELTRELMGQYRSLMAEGKYLEARAVADGMYDRNPDEKTAFASIVTADYANRYTLMEDLERRKQDGFFDVLADVELSTVPLPDFPPLIYPPAKVWEELTLRRAKYKSVDLSPVSEGEAKIRKALARPVSFDFNETPLKDVIDFLRDFTGVNIILDAKSLSEQSIEPSTPVTLALEQVTLKSALNLTLGPLNLTYLIRDEVLLITSKEAANTQLITKVYPVGDLVIPPGGGLGGGGLGGGVGGGGIGGQGGGGVGGQGGGFGGQGGGGNAFGGGGVNRVGGGQGNGNLSDRLRDLIINTIGASNFEEGGGPGRIGIFQNNLVVTATQKVHDDLDRSPILNTRLYQSVSAQRKSGKKFSPPTTEEWDAHFASARETPAALKTAVSELANANQHDAIVTMLQSASRHQPTEPWMLQALALSLQLTHAEPADVQTSILSLVDALPDSMEIRWQAAADLARSGMASAAIRLLWQTADRFPSSVRTLQYLLELAEPIDDLETISRAADRLLGQEWAKRGEAVHDQTRQLLANMESKLRREGRTGPADRIQQIAKEVQRRDLEVTLLWQGEADLDLSVIEPGDILCSPATPRTIQGGVLVSDGIAPRERYVLTEGYAGGYEVLVRPVFGKPVGGIATLEIVHHRGMPTERRERRTVPITERSGPVIITLADGRRRQPAPLSPDEHLLSAPAELKRINPLTQLRQVMSGQAITNINGGGISVNRQVPFVTGQQPVAAAGVVAFQPQVTVINDGVSMSTQAIVSADRRYVRLSVVPVLQTIDSVSMPRTVAVQGAAR